MKNLTKWLLGILIVVVVISAVFFGWQYFKNKNQKTNSSNSPELITINHQSVDKSYLSLQVLLPAGWISVPDTVDGIGFGPINFFSSTKDEQEFVKNINSGFQNTPFVNARVMQGTILDKKISDLTQKDTALKNNSNTQLLVEDKIFDGGNYRCYQDKNNNQLAVSCWVNYSVTGANFTLNTPTDNYQSDLQSFYQTIESLKFVK